MEGFPRCAIQAIEGQVEEGAVRFAGPGFRGGEDMLEKRTDAEAIQNGDEAVVEIGDYRERAKCAGSLKKLGRLGIEFPGGRGGVVLEEGIEVGVEQALLMLQSPRGFDGEQDFLDESAPPGVLRSVPDRWSPYSGEELMVKSRWKAACIRSGETVSPVHSSRCRA